MFGRSVLKFCCFLLGILLIGFISCQRDDSYFEGNARLEVSTDTITFDTVFTKVGTATQYFKIYNSEKNPILVDVAIKNESSQYRMNVDGYKGNSLKNIEIQGNDSIYVFIEATINPDDNVSISPFFIEDEIIIKNNESSKTVKLIAYGQNANYLPFIEAKGVISYLSCDLGKVTWDDPKPYVIYGVLIIDSCEIVIPASARIYVHGGVVSDGKSLYNDGQIIFLGKGKINVQGQADKKVIIEGDRPEPDYNDIPGQWGGIKFLNGSNGNFIDHLVLKNAIVGIYADSAAQLAIGNTTIQNCAAVGLVGRHSKISGDNILIFGTGSHSMSLSYGGDYNFTYCTLNSDLNEDESIFINDYRCTDPLCLGKILVNTLNFKMTNSIVAGGNVDEIFLDPSKKDAVGNSFNYQLENCVVKAKEILKPESFPNFFDNCKSCYNLQFNDKLFKNKDESNFIPDSLSVALDKALPLPNVKFDIVGKSRSEMNPDLGCFEINY